MGAEHILGTTVVRFETGPDTLGRRRFCVMWLETWGCYRHELGRDGQPVGYRRGQYFFARPWPLIRKWRKRERVVAARRTP